MTRFRLALLFVFFPASLLATPHPKPVVKGTLRVNTRPWTVIYINGERFGTTPQPNIKLDPGKYRITFKRPELKIKVTKRILIESARTVRLYLVLPVTRPELNGNTEPQSPGPVCVGAYRGAAETVKVETRQRRSRLTLQVEKSSPASRLKPY